MSDKEKIVRYTTDEETVLPLGYSRSDISVDLHFGHYRKYIEVKVTEEVATELRKMEENEHKRAQRANKCVHQKKGRCDGKNCGSCDSYCNSGDGSGNLSLDLLVKGFGGILVDTIHPSNPEHELMKAEFWKTFDEAVDAMSEEERIIAMGILHRKKEKEVMETLGITSQSIFSKKKIRIRNRLREILKDFRSSDFSY